jgi:hypothetical protein
MRFRLYRLFQNSLRNGHGHTRHVGAFRVRVQNRDCLVVIFHQPRLTTRLLA